MAETTLDLRHLPKAEAYALLRAQAESVLAGMEDQTAAMATIACLVFHAFAPIWAGFYRVVKKDELLRVGPYQGTLGCLEIAFTRGVCGAAARSGETVVVADVHTFDGHIACDSRARSEIVVPVFGQQGELLAVFDMDSDRVGAYDAEDARGLEALLAWFRTSATSGV
jgi:L-methionine (R)-S-oxide reductase